MMVQEKWATEDGRLFNDKLQAEEHETYMTFYNALVSTESQASPEEPIAISLAVLKMSPELRTLLIDWLAALNDWEDRQAKNKAFINWADITEQVT